MRVILTAEARRDLTDIGDHIAKDNPSRARTFVRELLAKATGIADAPYGFQRVSALPHLDVRRRACGNYLIFYRVKEDHIEIIHILHGARDYEPILFP